MAKKKPTLTPWQLRRRQLRNKMVRSFNSDNFQKVIRTSTQIIDIISKLALIRSPWALIPAGLSLLNNLSVEGAGANAFEDVEGLFPERFEEMLSLCDGDTPLFTSLNMAARQRVGLLRFCDVELQVGNKAFLTYEKHGFFVMTLAKVARDANPVERLSGSIEYVGPKSLLRSFFNELYRCGLDDGVSQDPGFDIPLDQHNINFANHLVSGMGAELSPTYMLYGPPGTGKTKYVFAMGSLIGRPVYSLSGRTGSMLPNSMTMESLPHCSLLLLDELRAGEYHIHSWIDNARRARPDCALFICTNTPKLLGPAILRPERGGELRPFPAPHRSEYVAIMERNQIPTDVANALEPVLPDDLTHDWLRQAGMYCLKMMHEATRELALQILKEYAGVVKTVAYAMELAEQNRAGVLEKAVQKTRDYIMTSFGLSCSSISAEDLVRMLGQEPPHPPPKT